MSYYTEEVPINPNALVSLTNAATSYVFDQTVNGGETPSATPGSLTDWMGGRLRGVYRCTGQNVSLKFYLRIANAGATTDWELDGNMGTAGVVTVTASVTQPIDWKINGVGRMEIVNGATGPTTSVFPRGLHWTPDVEAGGA